MDLLASMSALMFIGSSSIIKRSTHTHTFYLGLDQVLAEEIPLCPDIFIEILLLLQFCFSFCDSLLMLKYLHLLLFIVLHILKNL